MILYEYIIFKLRGPFKTNFMPPIDNYNLLCVIIRSNRKTKSRKCISVYTSTQLNKKTFSIRFNSLPVWSQMEKTYTIEVPDTIKRLIAILYLFGLWTKIDRTTFQQLCYIISFTFVVLLVFLGAYLSENKDRAVFLGVVWLVCIVQICRMYFIIWKQDTILRCIEKTAVNHTTDYEVYAGIDKKIKIILSIARTFIATAFLTTCAGIFLPFAYSEKTLILPIAFPVDYKTNEIAFWIAHACVIWCLFSSVICCLPMTIIWYLMLNIVVKFEVLGSEFKNLGGKKQEDSSGLYLQQLIKSIEAMGSIDEYDECSFEESGMVL